MGLLHTSNQMTIFLCFFFVVPLLAADPAENLTETDEAEFRQGGIAQQLMASSYPAGLYGGAGNAYQQYAAAGTGGSGYVNMLRNLYRPPSLGLTDKVKHWVKSFMNRRQYVKPYYGAQGLQYSADEFGASGKPVLMSGGGGYKAISIPLRQLQKYYKPYYGSDAAQFLQAQQPGSSSGVAASSSILSYNSPSGGNSGAGLFASETANPGHFSNGGAGLFGSGGSNSGLFGGGSSSGGLFSTGGNSGLFSSGSDGSSALFATGNGGSPGSSLFSGNPGGIYSSSGNSGSNLFSSGNDGSASALFGASGLYGSSGSSSSGLYHPSNSGSQSSSSSVYAIDSGSNSGLFGSDGGSSSYFGASNGGSNNGGSYGSRAAAASSLLTSLSGSNAAQYGDLYASGASPAASVYNPSSGDHQVRGYGSKKQQQSSYGASSSALYVPSGDSMRSPEAYPMKSSQDSQVNSFNVDSSRNSPAESSYSVSFQPAQGKSYSAPYENSGFQPVSFGAEDGFKGKSS